MAVATRMYARAIFQAAQGEGRLDEVAADLSALASAVEDTPALRAFLRNPQIDPPEKARVLDEIAAGADELVRNFLKLLAEKGRAGELVGTNEELEALVARAQNRLAVELTTAHELSEDEARSIVEQIEKASGRKVEATRSVDPSLVGGIVLQVGSFRADGSVRGRLERLRQELVTTRG
ncbi:MAG: ATP synthase F1 subunit delta [Actinomycetota bacterium]|nr:ATP synthase F1 subunit delta [Actinomycetota bacterium]